MISQKSQIKKKYPLVSVTMITHNRKDDVKESLEHIKKIKYPNWEMIIVDNDSTDGVAEMIEKEFRWTKLIKISENKPLRARNISFKEAKGEYVVTVDDDSYPEPEAISKMIERFENNPYMGIIAFNIPCGDYFSTEYWRECEAGFVDHYIGSGAGIRKAIFYQIGYYDETLDGYAEEFDFAYRASGAGYTIGHFKDIIAHHRPISNQDRARRFFYRNERNQQYLMGKFIPPIFWPVVYVRSTFYRLLRAYYLGGKKALWQAFMGNTLGAIYIIKGYRKRIALPPIIGFHIRINRSWPPLWKLFFKKTRQKIMARAKQKQTSHDYCPRLINMEAALERIKVTNIPPLIFKYLEINAKINIINVNPYINGKEEIIGQLKEYLRKLYTKIKGSAYYYDNNLKDTEREFLEKIIEKYMRS